MQLIHGHSRTRKRHRRVRLPTTVSTKIFQNKTIKNVYKTDTKVTEISNKYSENNHKLLLENDYASDLKSLAGYSVPVQVRPRVPIKTRG